MENKYCPTCQHEQNSIGFCDKCFYSKLCEEKGLAPTMYEMRPTNADRIRSLSDEELAWFYAEKIASCYGCESSTMEDCAKCWLDWLKSPVEMEAQDG